MYQQPNLLMRMRQNVPFAGIANPPFVPPFQLPQQFQQILVYAAGALALEIQQRADQTPTRTLLFNVMSTNNYQNNEFAEAVATVFAYARYLGMQSQVNDVATVCTRAAQEITPLLVAETLQRYWPQVGNQIDPTIATEAANGLQQLNSLRATISQFHPQATSSGMYQHQPMGNMPGMGAAPMGMNGMPGMGMGMNGMGMGGMPGMNGMGMGAAPNLPYQHNNSFYSPPPQQPGTLNGGTFRRANGSTGAFQQTPPQQPEQSNTMGDRFTKNHRRSFTDTTSATAAKAAPVEPAYEAPKTEITPKVWMTSKQQPYLYAYNPLTHTAKFELRNNKQFQLVQELTGVFDESEHQIPVGFGTMARGYVPTYVRREMEKVTTAIRVLTGDELVHDVMPAEEIPAVVRFENTIIETSLDMARFVAATAVKDKDVGIYTFNAIIAKPLIATGQDDAVFMEQLQLTKSIAEAIEIFNDVKMRDGLNGSLDVSELVWEYCERALTKAVNTVLKQSLSLHDWDIESIVKEWSVLLEVLESNHGELVRNLIIENAPLMMSSAFPIITDEELDKAKGLVGDQQVDCWALERVNFTVVNVTAVGLGLSLEVAKPLLLTNEYTASLLEMAEQIFKYSREAGFTHAKHLIYTMDGRKFQLNRGWLATTSRIITYIPESVI